jgi:hypothetical protein
LTHNHGEPRLQALFRTRTGEMSAAPLAPAGTCPLLTHDLDLRAPQFKPQPQPRRSPVRPSKVSGMLEIFGIT